MHSRSPEQPGARAFGTTTTFDPGKTRPELLPACVALVAHADQEEIEAGKLRWG